MPETEYTIQNAAEALGVSSRTIRRRIQEGKVSARKSMHGERQVWLIDGAELARYAQSSGQRLTVAATSVQVSVDNVGHDMADSANVSVTNGQIAAAHPVIDLTMQSQVDELRRTVAALEHERDFLRQILENVTKALPPSREEAVGEDLFQRLEVLETAVLRAAQEQAETEKQKVKRFWWQRLWGREKGP
jgi:excisionase family DNA binding protein